jgi:hypothetical protein
MVGMYNTVETLLLPEIEIELRKLMADMEQTGLTLALAMAQPLLVFVRNLTAGPGNGPDREDTSLQCVKRGNQRFQQEPNNNTALWLQYVDMYSAYFYGKHDMALQYSIGVHSIYTKYGQNSVTCAFVMFFECMVLLANAKKGVLARLRHVPYVKRRFKLLKDWAYMAPENLLDKQHLLQAELDALHGNHKKACANYRSGILHARTQGRHGLEGLGNERLAIHLIERGLIDDAVPLLEEACRVYETWGARAKVDQLRKYRDSLLPDSSV